MHWLVDNLPAATRVLREVTDDNVPEYSYERGYPLGFVGGTELSTNKFVEDSIPTISNPLTLTLTQPTWRMVSLTSTTIFASSSSTTRIQTPSKGAASWASRSSPTR